MQLLRGSGVLDRVFEYLQREQIVRIKLEAVSTARLEDGSITVDAHLLFQTAKLCEEPDGLMEQEKRYFGLVNRLSQYGIYGDRLLLQTADDVFLLFQAK